MTDYNDDMIAYVRYRLEKAQEVYGAACVLYDAAQWNSVINRLYYACFYSASALLLYKQIFGKISFRCNWAVLKMYCSDRYFVCR